MGDSEDFPDCLVALFVLSVLVFGCLVVLGGLAP